MSYECKPQFALTFLLTSFLISSTLSIPAPVPGPIGAQAITDLHAKIDNFINNNKLALVSATYCPYAKYVKRRLKMIRVKFAVFEVNKQKGPNGKFIAKGYSMDYLKTITGTRSVPQLFKNGVFLGQSTYVKSLVKQGKLKRLLSL